MLITDASATKDAQGALAGAGMGAVAGGLLGALAASVIPGIGPVLAGGMIATALGFAGAGAAVGGILGAMTGLGISHDEAVYYEEQFNEGKAIVTVRAGEFADKAVAIIRKHKGFTRRDELPPSDPTSPTPVGYVRPGKRMNAVSLTNELPSSS